jgi:hypothetical protein
VLINKTDLKKRFNKVNISVSSSAVNQIEGILSNAVNYIVKNMQSKNKKHVKGGNDIRFAWQTFLLGKQYGDENVSRVPKNKT